MNNSYNSRPYPKNESLIKNAYSCIDYRKDIKKSCLLITPRCRRHTHARIDTSSLRSHQPHILNSDHPKPKVLCVLYGFSWWLKFLFGNFDLTKYLGIRNLRLMWHLYQRLFETFKPINDAGLLVKICRSLKRIFWFVWKRDTPVSTKSGQPSKHKRFYNYIFY